MNMSACRTNARRLRRRDGGGVLLEVVIALTLFIGAASLTLAAARSVFTSLDQMRRRQEAVDLARSKLAELQAGLITLADLRGERADAVGSTRSTNFNRMSNDGGRAAATGWILDARTSRTVFTGLSLIELTVREDVSPEAPQAVSFTLRQLMPLRESAAQEYVHEP
jgi:hypothetical protein